MAKGLFGALKGMDAFGKVSATHSLMTCHFVVTKLVTDYGRCKGQDSDWCNV